jgi:hypothetical protein
MMLGSECDAYGRLKNANFPFLSCKVHLSFDMKRVVDIKPTDTFEVKVRKLEQEAKLNIGRNEWRESSMSEAERESRKQMKEKSREYLKEKWGVLSCKLKDIECTKPWPYCPTCPSDVPYCLDKTLDWDQLDDLRSLINIRFDADPDRPIAPAA